jgi:DNA-binding XRE family transcriptional regulator
MTPSQCRAGRALLDWTQSMLADAAGVGLSTVVDFEKERRAVSDAARDSIKAALIAGGVIFVEENGEGEGVRRKKTRH